MLWGGEEGHEFEREGREGGEQRAKSSILRERERI